MRNLAPVGVSTYSRINHLKLTIEALQKNTLAKDTELYIFSDAPQKGDEGIVAKVRKYIHTIDGFKEVHILERKTNGRVANNRGGIKQLLDNYGKMIFMEDDIVTAPSFLQFINDGLNFYENDIKVLSIGGFSPEAHTSEYDFYLSPRFQGWGFGIWMNRYESITYLPHFSEIKKNSMLLEKLSSLGEDMLSMVKRESSNKIDALDIKACYLCAKNDLYNILPTVSLVKNIGLDGSGLHCNDQNIYFLNPLNKMISFEFVASENINKPLNALILEKNSKIYKRKFILIRIINKLSRIIIGKSIINGY